MDSITLITGLLAFVVAALIVITLRQSAKINTLSSVIASSEANLRSAELLISEKKATIEKLEEKASVLGERVNDDVRIIAEIQASNKALNDKLTGQKQELEELTKKLNNDFEIIAGRILDSKTEKFTELNRKNLDTILEPLGRNIEEFKKTVKDTYITESRERFSLGEKVKELALLNQQISEEARNLTRALKGEAKTQGRWGEMILESILEKSGLRKGEEYFMEYQLTDSEGKPLRSDAEGKKMRPDAVIKYPDNRSVIIDSKVSLNAFTRYSDSSDPEEQKRALSEHIDSIKMHINELSVKGYDDYDKALDFVMMFIPSEPAYIAALQGDHDLWNYAYEKRILLLNPTNLITSLKLIVDLWKREYQNRNAQDIADRGAKLYDKFVGFVNNLSDVGKHLDKAKDSYNESLSQLSGGRDNLVLQAEKLRKLGIKNKKQLSGNILLPDVSEPEDDGLLPV
jgi:DNA recombination protein RmuC